MQTEFKPLSEGEIVNIGDIVAIDCVDWGSYAAQHSRSEPFKIVEAMVYGEVIAHTADGGGVVVAPQVFDGGDVRFTLVVPYCTIKRFFVLTTRKQLEDVE
jgi:hypothetical protein